MINIKQAREICDAATPGPWEVGEDEREAAATLRAQPVMKTTGKPFGKPVDVIMPFGRAFSDARFCAEARTLLPAALDEIERLQALVQEACDLTIRMYYGVDPVTQVELVQRASNIGRAVKETK